MKGSDGRRRHRLASPAAIRASPMRRGLVCSAPELRPSPDRSSRAITMPA